MKDLTKVFRALGHNVVEKRFIDGATPLGWHETVADALAAWRPAVVESPHPEQTPALPPVSDSAPKKRGRPRKE